jgi:hypothetical protein
MIETKVIFANRQKNDLGEQMGFEKLVFMRVSSKFV